MIGDKWRSAVSLTRLGRMARAEGDHGRARVLYEKILPLNGEIGPKGDTIGPLVNLGSVAFLESHHAEAKQLFEESLSISGKL